MATPRYIYAYRLSKIARRNVSSHTECVDVFLKAKQIKSHVPIRFVTSAHSNYLSELLPDYTLSRSTRTSDRKVKVKPIGL
jgi:hypothetical protein